MSVEASELQSRREVADRIAGACGITRRAAWGARPPTRPLEIDWNYDSIVVHYTGHAHYDSIRAIQDFDLGHQGWDDIAYHYVITKAGRVFEGREIVYKGSHVRLQNTGKIGIACLGDYDTNWRNLLSGESWSGDPVPAVLLDALRKLASVLRQVFPIRVLGGHKEFGDVETCPGSTLLPAVVAMRAEFGLAAPTFRRL